MERSKAQEHAILKSSVWMGVIHPTEPRETWFNNKPFPKHQARNRNPCRQAYPVIRTSNPTSRAGNKNLIPTTDSNAQHRKLKQQLFIKKQEKKKASIHPSSITKTNNNGNPDILQLGLTTLDKTNSNNPWLKKKKKITNPMIHLQSIIIWQKWKLKQLLINKYFSIAHINIVTGNIKAVGIDAYKHWQRRR